MLCNCPFYIPCILAALHFLLCLSCWVFNLAFEKEILLITEILFSGMFSWQRKKLHAYWNTHSRVWNIFIWEEKYTGWFWSVTALKFSVRLLADTLGTRKKTSTIKSRSEQLIPAVRFWMGRYNHSFLFDATIMVSKNDPLIGEHIVIIFCDTIGYYSNCMTCWKAPLIYSIRGR